MMMRVPPFQIAKPRRFQVNRIPKGNLVVQYRMYDEVPRYDVARERTIDSAPAPAPR